MTKRQIPEQLKHGELIAAVERFELPVVDRRVRGLLIKALARSRKAPLFPATQDAREVEWVGLEYLGLYQRIGLGVFFGHHDAGFVVYDDDANTAVPLQEWLGPR